MGSLVDKVVTLLLGLTEEEVWVTDLFLKDSMVYHLFV